MGILDNVFSEVWNEKLPSPQNFETDLLKQENEKLRNIRLRQEIQGNELDKRLKVQKAEWQKHIDDVKLVFTNYEKAFSNPNLSEASRENMLELAGMLKSSLTPTERIALAGIGSMRILSDDEQRAQEFDRRFPKPKSPMDETFMPAGHTAENMPDWARYYIQSAEYKRKRAIAIYGLEKGKAMTPMPALFPTDEKNVFAFRSPLTQRIDFVDLKNDLPEGMLKRAMDEKRTTLSEVARTGFIPDPDVEKKTVTFNGADYLVQSGYNVRTGKQGVMTTPAGPSQPQDLPPVLRNVMFALGIKDEDERNKVLTNPGERGLVTMLDEAMKEKDDTVKLSKFANIRARLKAAYPKNGWMPFVMQEAKGDFWNIIPFRKDTYHQKDSGIIWRQTTGLGEYVDANQQTFRAYKLASGGLADAHGNNIPHSKGVKEHEQVPGVTAHPVTPPVQNITVGDAAKLIAQSLVAGTSIDQKGAERVVEDYARKMNKGKPIKTEDFTRLWNRILALPKPTFEALGEFKDWLMNIPIPGTEK